MRSLTSNNALATTPANRTPIANPSVWSQADFPRQEDWSYSLSSETLHEIEKTMQAILREGRELITAKAFSLPSLADDSIKWLRELKRGRGFVVLKGLPIERYTDRELCLIYQIICSFIGTTLEQNVRGEQFNSVRDQGYDLNALMSNLDKLRGSMTRAALPFHTDSAPAFRGHTPDIFALLALQAARLGGELMLMSASTLHNIVLKEHPEYLERLYQPYYFDRSAEATPEELTTLFAPVFTYNDCLSIRYSIIRILDGYKVAGVPLTATDKEPLDFIEDVTQRKGLAVAFKLQRGEIAIANNRFVLHSRTAFEDYPQPEQKRHMVRAWLKFSSIENELNYVAD